MEYSAILDAIKLYGLAVTLLGALAVILTGVLKLVFAKRLDAIDKDKRKAIYETLCIALSAVLALIYFLVSKGSGAQLYWQEAIAVYAAAKILYPLYENFRVRDLVRFLLGKAKEKIAKEKNDG